MNSREKYPHRYEMRECPQCGEERSILKRGTWCSKRCARLAEKRFGPKHPMWKADTDNYFTLHKRVRAQRGNAKNHQCACGVPAFEWANLTGDYADVNDYEAMCNPCHGAYDANRRAA